MPLNNSRIGNRRDRKGRNKYKQGHYLLQNTQKYIGKIPIVYRSSWEQAFCKFCDLNDNVVKWSTEGIAIPYQIVINNQLETHRYIPDFYLEMVTDDPEKYERVIIEIKPKRETQYPEKPKSTTLKMLENYEYSLRTYKQNLHKWAYTKEWCEKRHIKFLIITEDDLKKKGLIS
jgi:hypothetical protein